MNHTSLLNYLVDKYKLSSYLELGVQNPANNFDKIKTKYRVGVDPNVIATDVVPKTSDWFFQSLFKVPIKKVFDLIFIDGLHHADQVERDFNNSLKCLNDGGFIVIHDCLPEKEETTHVPRDSKIWHGDVYKFVMALGVYENINFVTLNSDNGCCIVWKKPTSAVPFVRVYITEVSWGNYQILGKKLMNVIEPSELDNYLPKIKEPV